MRGPSKALPKYRKHRASGQALVTLCGQDFYLGPHGTKASKAEYDRLTGEWLANGRRIQSSQKAPLSILELCAAYLQHSKAFYVKNGKPTDDSRSYRDQVLPHLSSTTDRDTLARSQTRVPLVMVNATLPKSDRKN